MKIPLSRPDIGEREIEAVVSVLRTPYLSLGPKLREFEKKFAAYIGTKHAIGVSSGTAGLHLALIALGLSGKEVITTPFSFVASANCILMAGGRPVFADIEESTFNIDPGALQARISPETGGIIGVDVFGVPADWDALEAIASRHTIALIEDCCEVVGAQWAGRRSGQFGDAGVFAFYPNKQITTGEGGMVVTDSDEAAEMLRSLRNQGRPATGEQGGRLAHVRLGYNYRLDEMSCALGVAQLERLPEILAARERVAKDYHKRLSEAEELILPQALPGRSWFVYVVLLAQGFGREDRDAAMAGLKRRGIECAAYFPPIHLQGHFREMGYREGDFPCTESVAARTIALPFYNTMTDAELDYVASSLKEEVASLRSQ